jgi:hypothetical protein
LVKVFLKMDSYLLNENIYIFITKKEDSDTFWHKRIEHLSDKILKSLFYFKNLDCSNCEVYKLGKHNKLPFGLSNYKSKKLFELIHSDVWSSAPIESFNGYKYFIIFIDNFLRTTWLHLLQNKSNVFSQF